MSSIPAAQAVHFNACPPPPFVNFDPPAPSQSPPLPRTYTELTAESSHGSHSVILKEVLTKLEMVLQQNDTILRILQHQATPPGLEEAIDLPLADLPQLLAMEDKLGSPEFRCSLTNYLGTIGGTNVQDTTSRILKKILSHSLAQKMNWRGVNGKTALATLHLRKVVVGAVRKNPIIGFTTEAEVEDKMKRWLQLSADREGGRKRRLLAKEGLGL
uniref:DUF4806 domain-containing protein n=1 Tax=Knipowitschia caucasica TaxID=637954 RepID=A0AAV2K4H5_KNICA